jgi:hypothetical protein
MKRFPLENQNKKNKNRVVKEIWKLMAGKYPSFKLKRPCSKKKKHVRHALTGQSRCCLRFFFLVWIIPNRNGGLKIELWCLTRGQMSETNRKSIRARLHFFVLFFLSSNNWWRADASNDWVCVCMSNGE